nr:hypothetical protein CFP56_46765 [Quercus suber]
MGCVGCVCDRRSGRGALRSFGGARDISHSATNAHLISSQPPLFLHACRACAYWVSSLNMKSVCARCALRLHRAAQSGSRDSFRALSTTAARNAAVPTFVDTPNADLNEILATFRNKHFIPAALPKSTRRLIFEQKSRQSLEENPRTITLGDEEVELQWLDRTKDIPSKKGLLMKVLSYMQESGDESWRQNMPALLKGLYDMNPRHDLHNKIARNMVRAGQMETLLVCLQQAKDTGMSFRNAGVLDVVMWGLHHEASRDQWSEETLRTARRHASLVAMLLEGEAHTPPKGQVVKHDHRSRPWVIGTFLELEAAWVLKHQGGQDDSGKVKTYTERLLDCLVDEGTVTMKPKSTPLAKGPQYSVLHNVPVWHGLWLAQRVLGPSIPQPKRVEQILQKQERSLSQLAEALESELENTRPSKRGHVQKGRHMEEALEMWKNVIKG